MTECKLRCLIDVCSFGTGYPVGACNKGQPQTFNQYADRIVLLETILRHMRRQWRLLRLVIMVQENCF